jgi:hypothetical protein
MRFYKNPQGKLGEINISEIKLDKKSQDDVPRRKHLTYKYTGKLGSNFINF